MVTTASLRSTDNRMEGVQMGTNVVLFGSDAPLNPFVGTITYTVTGASPFIHLLTDLQPGHAFQISADGSPLGTMTSSSQGTLSFTYTPSGSQIITVQ
jgi:hypothetical protein